MIELRRILTAHLKTIHPRVYFADDAPADAEYPYIVYDILDIPDNGQGHQVANIDIDGWDAPADGDTTELENLMELINGDGNVKSLGGPSGLNKKVLTAEKIKAVFFLDRKLPLTEADKSIKRRKYVYQARFFERS